MSPSAKVATRAYLILIRTRQTTGQPSGEHFSDSVLHPFLPDQSSVLKSLRLLKGEVLIFCNFFKLTGGGRKRKEGGGEGQGGGGEGVGGGRCSYLWTEIGHSVSQQVTITESHCCSDIMIKIGSVIRRSFSTGL